MNSPMSRQIEIGGGPRKRDISPPITHFRCRGELATEWWHELAEFTTN
jgi:hypothetical protein